MTTVSGIPGEGEHAPSPKIRFFKTPRKRRRWPWVIFYSVWMVVGLVAAVAWGVDRAAQHLLDQISPNNSTVIAARKVLVRQTGPDTTFVILGSDHRNWVAGSESLSDSMILVRMSPRQNLISIMSVPRDLKVTIPGYSGYQKINAAYSLGGPKLSIQTVEQNLGVSINHYVNVGFQGFFQIVQHLGGLYTQVDRRYYNPLGTGYSPIDLQPGYQILNGNQALAFARFRHTDSDIVRSARQQQIIIDLKRQASEKLGITDVPLLLNTIAGSIETDVHSLSELINIGQFLIGLPHGRIFHTTLQVSFDTTPGDPAYDLASPQQIAQSVHAFMNPIAVAGKQISSQTVTTHPVAPATPTTPKSTAAGATAKQKAAAAAAAANKLPSGLIVELRARCRADRPRSDGAPAAGAVPPGSQLPAGLGRARAGVHDPRRPERWVAVGGRGVRQQPAGRQLLRRPGDPAALAAGHAVPDEQDLRRDTHLRPVPGRVGTSLCRLLAEPHLVLGLQHVLRGADPGGDGRYRGEPAAGRSRDRGAQGARRTDARPGVGRPSPFAAHPLSGAARAI